MMGNNVFLIVYRERGSEEAFFVEQMYATFFNMLIFRFFLKILLKNLQFYNLQKCLGNSVATKPMPIPWKSILTSIPVLGMIITDMGNCWGIITLGSFGPTFLKFMLGVDIKTNGVLSALPMLSRYLGGLFHAAIADYLLVKNILSTLWVRRIFNRYVSIATLSTLTTEQLRGRGAGIDVPPRRSE
jgi:hypothetical protein